MMMILRSATLLAAALTLANCCMSGTGCSGPMASANPPAATPAMAAAPALAGPQTAAAADWDGRVATSESDTEMVMEPDIGSPARKGGKRRGDQRVDVMSSQSSSGSRGRMSWEEEQAADLADEARLKQKLNICRNCNATQ
ncbi:hypothetical protein [Bradyrhizobium aeschynomenes]|uniref:hypothetical protein n=1 Tax=Bradyrhizobium aeschynomenes TaxID=2734909 RepID=UPI001FED5152|nr:hypothetical protein [Bradyrhizobium aeschynomenes]